MAKCPAASGLVMTTAAAAAAPPAVPRLTPMAVQSAVTGRLPEPMRVRWMVQNQAGHPKYDDDHFLPGGTGRAVPHKPSI
jgi:hypothetical protein